MNNIKKLREEKGISRQKLAANMCMSVSAIGRRERGELPLSEDEIIQLRAYLSCTYEELLRGKK